jgi:hypothetical protein
MNDSIERDTPFGSHDAEGPDGRIRNCLAEIAILHEIEGG